MSMSKMSAQVTVDNSDLVPVIDFRLFLDGSQKKAVAEAMIASLKHVGFIQIINHGVPQEKINNMFAWVRDPLARYLRES
jgi:isopenicillin N synthase-like dioxygenase